MEPMTFVYSFTINGYDVTVTIDFFPPYCCVDSSLELTDAESENVDISPNL